MEVCSTAESSHMPLLADFCQSEDTPSKHMVRIVPEIVFICLFTVQAKDWQSSQLQIFGLVRVRAHGQVLVRLRQPGVPETWLQLHFAQRLRKTGRSSLRMRFSLSYPLRLSRATKSSELRQYLIGWVLLLRKQEF